MKSLNKFKKKIRGNDAPVNYYCDEDFKDPNPNWLNGTLYEKADNLAWKRRFGKNGLDPENQLVAIRDEIKIRVKITKNEIFKIGELLIYAKNICQQTGKKFQEWISNNFDFSYETANNFMNVYKYCLGTRWIAMNVKSSILYKIATPGFPEELRQLLFDTEQLDEMTNGRLREITSRFKEGGFEAIKDDIEELNRGRLIVKQSCDTLDIVEHALRVLEDLKDKIEERGRPYDSNVKIAFEAQIKTDEPEAFQVNSKLISALHSAIEILDKAQTESMEILNNIEKTFFEKCGMVESDGRIEKRRQAEFETEHVSI
jgi:hypothetical protein